MRSLSVVRNGIMFASVLALTGVAVADPCFQPTVINNTVSLPPVGCQYLSPTDVHMIIAGLPAGTQINFAPIHIDFMCREPGGGQNGVCGIPTPNPGDGNPSTELFNSNLKFHLTGTGIMSGLNCNLTIPNNVAVVTGPRPPGPVQTFSNEITNLNGSITNETGCGIFQSLTIKAGTGQGLQPSTGQTTLTFQGGGQWKVDSFFDVFYEIDYVGAPGGPLAPYSGNSVAATPVHMAAAAPPPPVPGYSPWGVAIALALILGTAVWMLRRRMDSAQVIAS